MCGSNIFGLEAVFVVILTVEVQLGYSDSPAANNSRAVSCGACSSMSDIDQSDYTGLYRRGFFERL